MSIIDHTNGDHMSITSIPVTQKLNANLSYGQRFESRIARCDIKKVGYRNYILKFEIYGNYLTEPSIYASSE